MSRKNRTVDVVAGLALLGMVAVSALAQVGDPEPVRVQCPGGPVTLSTGATVIIPPFTCPEGSECGWAEVFNDKDVSQGAVSVCLTAE